MSFFILLFFILPISFQAYEFENLEELTPYNLVFSKGRGDYKLFKYSPKCNDQNTSLKNIYAQGVSSLLFGLALYTDYTQIKFSGEDGFINYISKYYLKTNITEIKDLICDEEYYFVVYIMDYNTTFLQFSILPGEVDTIDISSLSNSLTLFQRSEKEESLFYSSNESKNISISIFDYGKLKIVEKKEKEEITIIDMEVGLYYNLFLFEKDKKYEIYFSSEIEINGDRSPIIFQIYNDMKRHNFNDGPIIITGSKVEYNYEIDISKYNKGDYIVFMYFGSDNDLSIKYRYKNSMSDYLNELKKSEGDSYIPLKLTEKDSALMLNLKMTFNFEKLLAIDIFKGSYEEITSEYKNIIKEPKLFHINSYLLNNLNAIGIQSNQSYYLKEQEIGEDFFTSSYGKVSVITQDYAGISYPDSNKQKNIKDVFIFINADENNYSYFEIKKFNYPVYYLSSSSTRKIYFQMCNKKGSKDELYFYSSDNFFSPVFGNLNINVTYSHEINSLSDINYNKSIENNFKFREPAYLKMTCNNPVMFTNIRYTQSNQLNYTYNLKTSEKIYLSQYEIENNNYTLDNTLVNKEIQLRFKVYGLNKDQSIALSLDTDDYELDSSKPLEIDYTYQKYTEDLIKFSIYDENITNNILIEITVGSQSNDYTPIEFSANMDPITIQNEKGKIIKIPKDFNDDLLNYFIVFPKNTIAQVEISYDDIKYIVPRKRISITSHYNNFYELVSLFKNNPYSNLAANNENTDNKFFYILIYNEDTEINISFKKPKIISNIALNKLNVIPELKDEKNSFYQINIPNSDYKSLIFQIISPSTSNTIKISISHNNIEQPYVFYNNYYYSLPTYKVNPSINIYNTYNNSYINIAQSKEFILKEEKNYKLNATIKQVNNTNKLKITMNSLSSYYSQFIYKYYLIINSENKDILDIASIISGDKELDTLKNQTIITIEEDSSKINKIIDKEVKIKIKLNEEDSNNMIIVPAVKENNLLDIYSIEECEFNFTNYEENSEEESDNGDNGDNGDNRQGPENTGNGSNTLVLVCCIGGGILLILIIIILILVIRRRKNMNSGNIEKKVLNSELNITGLTDD